MAEQHSYPSNERLSTMLDLIDSGMMALPDFQRDFVWDPGMTDELLESLIRNFPAGTLLRIKNGQDLMFKPRPFQGAPELGHKNPTFLVLDGQQRLTSLYQALYGVGRHRFLLHLSGLESGKDLDECAFYETKSKFEKRWGSIDAQSEQLVFPLGRLFGDGGFDRWMLDVLRSRGSSRDEIFELQGRLSALRAKWLEPLEQYQFPVVEINEKTEPEAVCTIFETLNRTGVRLSVFDLLTARFWPHEVKLRDWWEEARVEWPILAEFDIDPYYLLQVAALIEPGLDRQGEARPPSVKVGDVLALTPKQVQDAWPRAVRGMVDTLQILQADCGVVAPRWLPYGPMLVPAAAAWARQLEVAKGPVAGANRSRLVKWFWCSALGQRYEYSVNSQCAKDYLELVRWMTEPESAAPESVTAFTFGTAQLRSTTPRQRSLYRAAMALFLRLSPRDFHKRGPITGALFSDAKNPVDDHHIFPAGYLNPLGVIPTVRDSILNRTLIDRTTNIRIGKRAPSDYLAEIEASFATSEAFDELLASHTLPAGNASPLRADDFEAFLSWRQNALADQVEAVTGVAVARDSTVDDFDSGPDSESE